jgi:hypothetical protein|nr:MAG TPA: hypothetical protein [Caudoviricetes sp.]
MPEARQTMQGKARTLHRVDRTSGGRWRLRNVSETVQIWTHSNMNDFQHKNVCKTVDINTRTCYYIDNTRTCYTTTKQEDKTMKKTIDYTALADTIRAELNARHDRSAWDKAVTLYALDLLEDVQEGADNMERLPLDGEELERWALNGASCWEQYSNGGCPLCYNADIAARVCTPSELKRKHGGTYEPNSRETWLDVQARALYQACNRIRTICRTNGLYCKEVQ